MQLERFSIEGLALITPKYWRDDRGFFVETFKDSWFRENVADVKFVQDNQSFSKDIGTIRGLHYQKAPFGQGKLIRVIKGKILDVAVDARCGSKTFGQHIAVELDAENGKQLWIPDGFLHGFCTLVEDCEICYKVTNEYSHPHDAGIAFDDPDIGVKWPVDIKDAVLSEKDKKQPPFKSLLEGL